MKRLVFAALSAVLLVPTTARADEESYGRQIVLADTVSAAVTFGGLFAMRGEGGFPFFIGLGSYALASPVIHVVHGRPGTAIGSFALRVIAIPVAGYVGVMAGAESSRGCKGDWCGLGGAVIGGMAGIGLGMLAVTTADAVLFAHESDTPKPKPKAVSVTPILAFDHGAQAGLAGSF